jgi:hypothetical protein
MRVFVRLVAVSLALGVAAAPVSARVVRMETKVTLEDHSELGIKLALREAFQLSVRGAIAMGLPHVSVDGVSVLPDALVLALVAADESDDARETRSQ